MNFDQAFEALIGHEGGHVNNPADPGGETQFGICKRSYPNEDIAGMTLDRAKALYMRDYWTPAACESLPDGVRMDVFDMAVNSGVGAALRTVQKAVGAAADGVLGPVTRQAVQDMQPAQFVARFNAQRLLLMTSLPTWSTFGRGWAVRVAEQLMQA